MIFFHFFIFILVKTISGLPNDTSCMNAQSKCFPLVNELMFQTEQYKTDALTIEIAKNISELCENVVKCFGEFNTTDAQRNKETYQQKCQKLNFLNFQVHECVAKINRLIYERTVTCARNYDYFSRNSTIKRAAFTSGKSCFLSMAATNCSTKSQSYLNSTYPEFVNIITTPPKNNKCTSVHDEMIASQCYPVIGDSISRLQKEFEDSDPVHGRSTYVRSVCEEMLQCMNNSCTFTMEQFKGIRKTCEKARQHKFAMCLNYIKTSQASFSKYDCVAEIEHGTYQKSGENNAFARNETCSKIVMEDKCHKSALENFDEDWKNRFDIMDNN